MYILESQMLDPLQSTAKKEVYLTRLSGIHRASQNAASPSGWSGPTTTTGQSKSGLKITIRLLNSLLMLGFY